MNETDLYDRILRTRNIINRVLDECIKSQTQKELDDRTNYVRRALEDFIDCNEYRIRNRKFK